MDRPGSAPREPRALRLYPRPSRRQAPLDRPGPAPQLLEPQQFEVGQADSCEDGAQVGTEMIDLRQARTAIVEASAASAPIP